MTNADRFEYPLPVLHTDTDHITMNTLETTSGAINIKNTGGGVLEGRVLSRCPGLFFPREIFVGNNEILHFTFTPAESAEGMIYILSNGGEKAIPVYVKPTRITAPGGFAISDIYDFYEYSQKNPAQAQRIFTDSEFYMLLLATGYEYMEVYEALHKDANRKRAMVNFFIVSGIKDRVAMEYKPPFIPRLSRDAYKYADAGSIEITNNTGVSMQVDVSCRDSYIRFFARAYPIDAYGEIPFAVRLSPLMAAQLFFRNQPFMQTEIEIKATIPGAVYKRRLKVFVGEW